MNPLVERFIEFAEIEYMTTLDPQFVTFVIMDLLDRIQLPRSIVDERNLNDMVDWFHNHKTGLTGMLGDVGAYMNRAEEFWTDECWDGLDSFFP